MRRLTAVGATIVVVALALAAALPASSQQGRGQRTFRVIEVSTEGKFLDRGQRGPSLGDEIVFHSDLRKGGETIGHDGGTCTLTSLEEGPEGEFQCVVTLWFDDGQITVQGLVQFTQEEFDVAITGGTGAYEGAAGHISVVQVTGMKSHLTISLLM